MYNGGEYLEDVVADCIHTEDFHSKFASPYIPEWNTKAERLNCTLLDRTGSMINQTGVELWKDKWDDSLCTENYIRNLMYTSAYQENGPALFEVIPGINLDLRHIREIG